MSPLRKKCVHLTTPTCCAPVSWHKPLSCFAGSVLAKGQSRHFGSPGVEIHYHLEGMHCLGHAVQWLLLRAYLKCCRNFGKTHAANNYDIRKKQWVWKTIIIFLPLFFPPSFQQCHHPIAVTVPLHWPLWPAARCPLPSPESLHTPRCISGSCPNWKRDLDHLPQRHASSWQQSLRY